MNDKEITSAETLLRRARLDDDSALGRLLERYRNYLTLLARLQLGRQLQAKADPTDVVQETFLKAHRDFSRFRGATEKELAGWLRRILAANLASLVRRYHSAQRRDVRLERDLAAQLDQSSRAIDAGLLAPGSTPSQKASRREQGVLLADALGKLPDDYREVIILRHIEELSFSETAQRMDRSEGAVKKLWARALARLRRLLGEL